MPREMKDSGIEWIGEIPADWKVVKVANQYTERKVKVSDNDYPPLSVTMKGILPQLATAAKTDAHDDRKLVCKGDFAINSRSDRRGSCGISPYDGSVSLINTILKPRDEMNAEYYDWLFHTTMFSDEFYKWGHGIVNDLWTTNWQDMKKISIPEPALSEQQRISAHLDIECAKIDDVISKSKATIEEYKKLKQSVITETVTKGIRPNREMKDSGIEWIGEIPKEWEISLIKYHLKWKSEKGFSDEQVLSLYRDYGVIPKDSRDDNHNVTSLDTSTYKLVDTGDFVINKMKAWQGSMAVSEYRGIISPAYHICEFYSDAFIKRYFHYLMRNNSYLPEYERLSTGMRIGQWDLGFDDFKNIPIIIPSLSEQQEIADYLDKKCYEIDTLIAKKEQIVTELESYKKSLIYEYVTGKKEVIQWTAI